jgi:hypothetical protein
MNKHNNNETAVNDKAEKKIKRAKRSIGNLFYDRTDEELEEFFKVLDSLKSPEKEFFFVEYCINPSILQ